MRPLHLILFSLFIISGNCVSQVAYWTWEKGPSTYGQTGTYGTMGTAATNNNPGARSRGVTWTDSTNNLWLFGGFGQASAQGFLNDLWKYNQSTGNWTWMKGASSTNSSGSYGTMGTASSSNNPHSRNRSVSWVDDNGNFWLFGGSSSAGYLNDLWKYDPSSNNWTWVNGTNTTNHGGVYGTQGTASSSNVPGARAGSSAWKDDDGNLWIFGGVGKAGSSTGMLNDLWMYSITTNQWTWVSGSSGVNQYGSYGTQGVSSASNKPGARNLCVAWKDADGNFWLWGGNGRAASSTGLLNDLWLYNTTTNQWTWMKGSNGVNQSPSFGSMGTAAASNTPGGSLFSMGWVGNDDDLYLFGGRNANSSQEFLGALWRYDISTNSWTWVKGPSTPNQTGTYGTIGSGNNNNVPGCRDSGVTWKDGNGEFWMFGGIGYSDTTLGFLSDLWRFSDQCNLEVSIVNQSDPLCHGLSTGVAEASTTGNEGNLSYNWSTGANTATASGMAAGTHSLTVADEVGCTDTLTVTLSEPSQVLNQFSIVDEICEGDSNGQITASASGGIAPYGYIWSGGNTSSVHSNLGPGSYVVDIIDANNCQISDTAVVAAGNPLPEPSLGADTTVTAAAHVLFPGVFHSYLWQDGSTSGVFTAVTTGTYAVTVSDVDGCEGADEVLVTFNSALGISAPKASGFGIYPNPCVGLLNVENPEVIATYAIYDSQGRLVEENKIGDGRLSLDISAGTYTLIFIDKNRVRHSQLLIVK